MKQFKKFWLIALVAVFIGGLVSCGGLVDVHAGDGSGSGSGEVEVEKKFEGKYVKLTLKSDKSFEGEVTYGYSGSTETETAKIGGTWTYAAKAARAGGAQSGTYTFTITTTDKPNVEIVSRGKTYTGILENGILTIKFNDEEGGTQYLTDVTPDDVADPDETESEDGDGDGVTPVEFDDYLFMANTEDGSMILEVGKVGSDYKALFMEIPASSTGKPKYAVGTVTMGTGDPALPTKVTVTASDITAIPTGTYNVTIDLTTPASATCTVKISDTKSLVFGFDGTTLVGQHQHFLT